MIIDYDQLPKLVENNLEVKVREATLFGSKLRVNSLASYFIPEVSLYTQAEESKLNDLTDDPTAGVFLNLNLFNGFRDVEHQKINQLQYNAGKLENQKSYNESVFLAKKYFFQVLKIQENIKTLTEYENINKNNRNLILKKVTSGLSPRSEEFIFKKIELELREQKIKEDSELRLALSHLRNILALDKNEKIELAGAIDISKHQYVYDAKKLDLAIVETHESLIETEKKMTGLWRMPRVNLYAERSFTDHVNGEILEVGDENQVIGVRLTLPIFSEKNIESIDAQVKKTEYQASILKKKSQIRELESTEEQIEIELTHLKTMIDISRNKVELSKEIMEKTFAEFRVGLKEADKLNSATADYIEAKKDMMEHQLDYILAVEEAKVNSL